MRKKSSKHNLKRDHDSAERSVHNGHAEGMGDDNHDLIAMISPSSFCCFVGGGLVWYDVHLFFLVAWLVYYLLCYDSWRFTS